MKIRWHSPNERPISTDAILVTEEGLYLWCSWYDAAPGNWEQTTERLNVKKWCKIRRIK